MKNYKALHFAVLIVFSVGLAFLAGCSHSNDIARDFNGDSITQLGNDLNSAVTHGRAQEIDNSEETQQACAEFVERNLSKGNYKLFFDAMMELNDVSSFFPSLITAASNSSSDYCLSICENNSFDDAYAALMNATQEIGIGSAIFPGMGIHFGMEQAYVRDYFANNNGIVITEGMEGYYRDHPEEDIEYSDVQNYKEGRGSALKDLDVAVKWTYFGDYAVKEHVTARDSLTNKPGEPVDFHYSSSYSVYYKGKEVGISSDQLEGMLVNEKYIATKSFISINNNGAPSKDKLDVYTLSS